MRKGLKISLALLGVASGFVYGDEPTDHGTSKKWGKARKKHPRASILTKNIVMR